MDFLSGIFVAIAGFFGFGGDMTVDTQVGEPAPVVEVVEAPEDSMSNMETDGRMEGETADTPAESGVSGQGETDASVSMEGSSPETQPAVTNYSPQTMIVAGGCFWCVEADLEKLEGVIDVVSGYSGGTTQNPTYKNYGDGGHREVVLVTYDPNIVSFEDVLIVTMKTTDPTDDDGTFHDRGDKYSSAFYYESDAQKRIIDNLIAEVNEYGPYDKPLAIDVEPRAEFWPAEDYHQNYYSGALTQLKYNYYRSASGRNDFIDKYWGANGHTTDLPWRTNQPSTNQSSYMWTEYQKPSEEELKSQLDDITFKVTQKEGTERAGTSWLDKNYEPGIYVDILSGEPLYSSKDKFDSGTGWPSFTKPITPNAVTEHEDRKLFTVRTEIRSAIADNHLGHVFSDGPQDSTGLRYCMNGVSLKFIPKDEMVAQGYGDFVKYVE